MFSYDELAKAVTRQRRIQSRITLISDSPSIVNVFLRTAISPVMALRIEHWLGRD